jgi:hypothetical protein
LFTEEAVVVVQTLTFLLLVLVDLVAEVMDLGLEMVQTDLVILEAAVVEQEITAE